MTPRRPTTDLLLEHSGFLHRLARSLVFDDQRAQDVVQDAYVAALEQPWPAPGRLRGWLAGIVRNRARRTLRTEGRLRRREQAGARTEALPSTAEVATRLEAQQRLADALAALGEPGRSTLVHRYFDGMQPAEIAERQGISVRTVESRLRRAKDALRTELDQAYQGKRRAWQVALVPSFGVLRDAASASGTGAAAGSAAGSAAGTAAATTTVTTTAWIGGTLMASKAALAMACVVGGAAAGYLVKTATTPAPEAPATTGPVEPAGLEGAGVSLGTDATVLANAQRKAETLAVSNTTLQEEVERLRTQLAQSTSAPKGAGTSGAAAASALAGKLRLKKFGDAVEGIEWAAAGEAVVNMQPLMKRFTEGLAMGKQDPELAMKIGRQNLKLINLAMAVKDKGLPGTDINGAFTHPAVYVPLIDATLSAAGLPLDESQREQLVTAGDAYIDADGDVTATYNDTTLGFTVIANETRLKERFFDQVDNLLSAAQLNALHPEANRGQMGTDIFSAGLLWQQHVAPIRGSNDEERLTKALDVAVTHLQVSPEHREMTRQAIADFLGRVPREIVNRPMTAISRMGMVHIDRIMASLEPMELLYAELLRILPAEGPHVQRIKNSKHVFLPMGN